MKNLLKTLIFFSSVMATSQVFAQEEFPTETRSPAQINEDRQVSERAKAKHYKGGAEEGELRVQAQLPKAQRKVAPVVEKPEAQDHD